MFYVDESEGIYHLINLLSNNSLIVHYNNRYNFARKMDGYPLDAASNFGCSFFFENALVNSRDRHYASEYCSSHLFKHGLIVRCHSGGMRQITKVVR